MVRWLAMLVLTLVIFPGKVVAVDSTMDNTVQDNFDQARQEIRNQVRTNVQENIAERIEQREQIRPTIQAKRDATTLAVCERITARIENRLKTYNTNQENWAARHNGVIKRLSSLADKLESRGCDISPLRADIDRYEELMTQFAASFRLFHESLNGSRAYACGESEGQFVSKLGESRQQLTAVRQNALALQNFFQNSLRLHLRQVGQACGNPANLSPAPNNGDAL